MREDNTTHQEMNRVHGWTAHELVKRRVSILVTEYLICQNCYFVDFESFLIHTDGKSEMEKFKLFV